MEALSSNQVPHKYNPYPTPTHSATVKGSHLLGIVTTQDVLKGLKEPENSIDASQQLYSKAKLLATGQGQTEINLIILHLQSAQNIMVILSLEDYL